MHYLSRTFISISTHKKIQRKERKKKHRKTESVLRMVSWDVLKVEAYLNKHDGNATLIQH